jgi:hypothetical protein
MPPLGPQNFEARKGRVSASEIAALTPDGHPYMDSRDVYDRLVGLRPIDAPSPAMRLGTILEPAILAAASDRWGWRTRANARTLVHSTLPLCATPDAYELGSRRLIEVKHSGNWSAWINLPAYVWWQAQAQMMCAPGYESVWVVVLAGQLRRWQIDRHPTASRRIARAARQMLTRVETLDPPAHATRNLDEIDPWRHDVPRSIIEGATK